MFTAHVVKSLVAINVKLGFLQASGCLEMMPKNLDKIRQRINTDSKPIADKYREGNLKSYLKRELNSTRTARTQTEKRVELPFVFRRPKHGRS